MEIKRSIISIGGNSVPGITRDGVFIGESPIETYCWIKINKIASNEVPQIILDYPVLVDVLYFDLEEVPNFPVFFQIEVIFPGVQSTMILKFEQSNIVRLGDLYQIKLPTLPLMEGAKTNFLCSHVLRSMHLYCKLIQIIDIKSF